MTGLSPTSPITRKALTKTSQVLGKGFLVPMQGHRPGHGFIGNEFLNLTVYKSVVTVLILLGAFADKLFKTKFTPSKSLVSIFSL